MMLSNPIETLSEYNLEAASYVVPNGFNRRALLT